MRSGLAEGSLGVRLNAALTRRPRGVPTEAGSVLAEGSPPRRLTAVLT